MAVPASLIEAMRAGPCLNLVLPDEERVALLLEDYDFFVQNSEAFCERLDALTELKGKQVVEGWKQSVRSGRIEDVVRDLLLSHYDPVYLQSMARNFKQFSQASEIRPKDRSVQAMRVLAEELVAQTV